MSSVFVPTSDADRIVANASKAELEDYFNFRLQLAKKTRNLAQDTPPFEFSTFVLSHLDISPRNLILDGQDRLWLIDWEAAGAYPDILELEAVTLACQSDHADFNQLVLERLSYDKTMFDRVNRLRSVLHFFDEREVPRLEAFWKSNKLRLPYEGPRSAQT